MIESKKQWPWQKQSPSKDGLKQTAEHRLDDVEHRLTLLEAEVSVLERKG